MIVALIAATKRLVGGRAGAYHSCLLYIDADVHAVHRGIPTGNRSRITGGLALETRWCLRNCCTFLVAPCRNYKTVSRIVAEHALSEDDMQRLNPGCSEGVSGPVGQAPNLHEYASHSRQLR
jgi:hypothetical protein